MKRVGKKRVPFIYQIEATECGAACLCMVLAYYKRYVPLAQMRRDCFVSRDGSKLRCVMNAAEKYGLKAEAFRVKVPAQSRLPAILFWNANHFVVLEQFSEKKIVICDPAVGRHTISREEFDSSYSGIILTLEKTEAFRPGGKPFSSTEIIRSVVRDRTGSFAYVGFLIFILNLVGIMVPGMVRMFVDDYQPNIGSGSMNYAMYFAALAGIIAVQLVLTLVRNRIILRSNHLVAAQINSNCIEKLLHLPLAYYQTRSGSGLLARLKSIDTLSDFISSKIMPVLLGLIFSLVYFGLLIYYSPLIGAAVAIVVIVVILILLRMISVTKTGAARASNDQIQFCAQVSQNLRIYDTIKSTATEKAAMDRMARTYFAFENAQADTSATMANLQAIPTVVPLLIQTVTIIIGGCEIMNGNMTMGAVLACQSIGLSVFSPIADFILQFQYFQSMNADIRGLMDIENEEADSLAMRDNAEGAMDLRGGFEMRDVSFGYNKSIPPVIRHVSFSVQPGKSLAIVGASGSGKTTLLRLLEGLYAPDEGDIFVDGVQMDKTERRSFADSVAVVSQTASLFTGTVRENLTMFNRNVDTATMKRAAADACILHDISERRQGFAEDIVPPNINFSGGQVQRMMIARALIKDPTVLILDEATSALDPIVEEQVMRNIRARGITMIIVAHRLSTIRDCDEIVVLEKGEITQRGTHDELISDKSGLYFRLVASEEDA